MLKAKDVLETPPAKTSIKDGVSGDTLDVEIGVSKSIAASLL